jgi:hypothetical protein
LSSASTAESEQVARFRRATTQCHGHYNHQKTILQHD